MKEIKKIEYINPDYVYVPYEKSLRKKIGDYVYMEEIIALGNNNSFIYPSISGEIIKELEINTINGMEKSIVVENDFKEKRKNLYPSHKKLYDLTRDELNAVLKSFNIIFNKRILIKIFNKKNLNSESILFSEYVQEILELLDVLNTYLKKEVYLLVKSSDLYILDALNKYKETYPNIKVMFDDKKETDVISVFDIYKIYYILKNKRLLTFKYISIITKNKTYEIKVKLYTRINDILKELNIDAKAIKIIDTKGNNINASKEYIITENLTGIIVN